MASTGGSATNQAPCNRAPPVTWKGRKDNALLRVEKKIGRERMETLKERWANLNVCQHGKGGDGDIGDGFLLCLMMTAVNGH